MADTAWIRSPRHLAGVFIVVVGILLLGLGWLGHRVLRQQADLDSQRLQTQLGNSSAMLSREIDRALAQWESLATATLAEAAVTVPAGVAVVVVDAQGLVRAAGAPLPYYPARARAAEDYRQALRAAETAEFQTKDLQTAADLYTGLAAHADRRLAAMAMLGAARVHVRLGRPREALADIDRLVAPTGVTIAGAPVELVAHRMRLDLFERSGDRTASARERAWLEAALTEGRLLIDRATFDEYSATLGLSPAPSPQALAMADAISDHWSDWLQTANGRAAVGRDQGAVIAVWRRRDSRLAIVTGHASHPLAALGPLARDLNVHAGVLGADGARLWGSTDATRPAVSRELRGDTGLPLALTVSADASSAPDVWASRQELFGVAFGLLVLVVAGAAYTVFRFVSKELAVARLQSDFVSAVSHEFRTPLTALRHVSHLLEEGAAAPQDLPEFYRAISKESRRLQGLVENLLDFGKLESGRQVYDFGDLDAAALTRDAAQDVAGHAAMNGHQVRLVTEGGPLSIRADRHAVTLALRNIIENAVKYSPDADAIDIRVVAEADRVAIAVQDYGVGVPASEQHDVFRKFVRGSAARALMIKGTGIGLAMADRIVRDHGGSITLESEPGRGSTFTVTLPRAHA